MTTNEEEQSTEIGKRTAQAFLWTNFLRAPFWGIYVLLIFILKKEYNNDTAVVALIALRPALSLFAPYWSALVHNRPDRLRSNVIIGTIIGHAPFFFFPFIDNPWFPVFAGALFLTMKRSIIPAWMELLKRNLPRKKSQSIFSYGNIISFVLGSILPILFAHWMDGNIQAWKYIFVVTSALSLLGTFFMMRIPVDKSDIDKIKKPEFNFKESVLRPWKTSYNLLKKRADFFFFQIGFMLGGGGLMIMQPAITGFFCTELNLSYKAIAAAVATCKGIGFVMTSRTWSKIMKANNIYFLSGLVTLLAAFFTGGLFLAKTNEMWVYASYILYGVMQAGSELSWHISGPIFSHKEDSSPFSSVNILAVGLRGVFFPFLARYALIPILGPVPTILLAGGMCMLATAQLTLAQRKYANQLATAA